MEQVQRKKAFKTAAYYVGFVALGMSFASLGPTLPGLAKNTNSLLSEISWLFFSHSAGYSISSLFGGRLYDRISGHPIIAVSLAIVTLTMAVIPFISWLWVLTAVFFVRGLASGTIDVGGNTLLVWVHGDRSGPWLNFLHFFFGVGGLAAPAIVAQSLTLEGDIAYAYWAIAAFVLPVMIWMSLLESPHIGTVEEKRGLQSSKAIMVALITLFFFLHVGIQVSYSGWIYTYAVQKGILKSARAAYLTSLFWGAITVGRLATVPISSRVAPLRILAGSLAGCLVGAGLLLLFPDRRQVLWLSTFLMGFSLASMFPVSILFAERCMHISGKVVGVFLVGANTGGMVLPWIIGQRFERGGPRVLSETVLLAIAVAFVVLLFMSLKASGLQGSRKNGKVMSDLSR
jgi:FHS family Na+ dependent glucose MFS transporter 1